MRFFVVRRQREQQHVAKALGDLRQSIWAFARSLGTVLMEDPQADDRLKLQIERLKVALERLLPEELREEVAVAASRLANRRALDELLNRLVFMRDVLGERPSASRRVNRHSTRR